MKKFGFSKKSSDGDDDSIKSGMFGRKKSSPKPENPYAQSQVADDPYARMTPYQQAKAGLSNGPRPGGVGLPGGPSPRNAPGGPPPPYSSQPGSAAGYGSDRYGSQNGYGSNRYEQNAEAYAANSRYGASVPSSSSGSRPGGYGGMGDTDDNRDALFGGAKDRYVPSKNDSAPTQAPNSYGRDYDQDGNRGALFGGARDRYDKQQSAGYGRSGASGAGDSSEGYGEPRELTAEEREEQDVLDMKDEIKKIKREDVQITDRTLATALQARDVAMGTLARLGAQGERLHNTEKNLDLASNYNQVAEERTRELKTLNGSMFAVHVNNPFTKKERKAQRDAEVLERHRMERDQREATRKDAYTSNQRLERQFQALNRGPGQHQRHGRMNAAERANYTFEGSDEEDDVIDDNLDKLAPVLGQLKEYAVAMSDETERQNNHLDRIAVKSDLVDDGVRMNREKLNRIR
ncbi:Plasma membrane snare protein [Pleurostoma richardsiae]|uniref:Plasma membrane snare protein n=1 Tax=Pleurostoma richardsiae TaxID=41990 RepID=A0AA38SDX8_9PEZI|nr:Plasma membrane snare protein [Pleurostoma richardsiae]